MIVFLPFGYNKLLLIVGTSRLRIGVIFTARSAAKWLVKLKSGETKARPPSPSSTILNLLIISTPCHGNVAFFLSDAAVTFISCGCANSDGAAAAQTRRPPSLSPRAMCSRPRTFSLTVGHHSPFTLADAIIQLPWSDPSARRATLHQACSPSEKHSPLCGLLLLGILPAHFSGAGANWNPLFGWSWR